MSVCVCVYVRVRICLCVCMCVMRGYTLTSHSLLPLPPAVANEVTDSDVIFICDMIRSYVT